MEMHGYPDSVFHIRIRPSIQISGYPLTTLIINSSNWRVRKFGLMNDKFISVNGAITGLKYVYLFLIPMNVFYITTTS